MPRILSPCEGNKERECETSQYSYYKEYSDVFPEELPGLPPFREIAVLINTFP